MSPIGTVIQFTYRRAGLRLERAILALKIFHMQVEAERKEATEEHRRNAAAKLQVLLEQRNDLSQAIDQLLEDIAAGKKYMKVYRQMKMYNDENLNPVLYAQKQQ